MFSALGREWVDKLGIGGLVKNPEGRLEVPPLLLLLLAATRRSLVLLMIREPVALFELFPGRPNGAKDSFIKELAFERKAPLCFYNEVNTNVDFQRGPRKEL